MVYNYLNIAKALPRTPRVLHKTLRFESYGMTDIGLVREHNEDAWAAYPQEGFFVLADGMGGHLAGEVAANDAVDLFYTLFQKKKLTDEASLEEAVSFFKETYVKINGYIHLRGENEAGLKGMGTTLCSLFFLQNEAIVAHVGDSRIYRLRNGELAQITEDHTRYAELLSQGALSESGAESFPYKHILTRAVGTHLKVECDLQVVDVEPHDIFMLCSDGLTNFVTHEQIQKILVGNFLLEAKGQMLINLAIQQGGGDNITLILVDTKDDLSR